MKHVDQLIKTYKFNSAGDLMMSLIHNPEKQCIYDEAQQGVINVMKYCVDIKNNGIGSYKTSMYMLIYFLKRYTTYTNIKIAEHIGVNRMTVQRIVKDLVNNYYLTNDDLKYNFKRK